VLGVAGAVAIGVGAFTLSGQVAYPGAAALLPVLGAAAVIAAGFRSTSIVPRALATTPMVKIGDASYSLYLWHWPLIVFAGVLWPDRPWVLVAAAVVSVVPALVSYLGVEKPIRGNPTIRGRRVLSVLAACVLVPTIAGATLLIGARSSWGNDDVERMQDQVGAEHAGERLGCDEGASGQVDAGTTCEFNAGSRRTKVYLFGNSIAAMYSEALIGATERLDLPLSLDTHSGGFCATIDAEGCQDMFVDSFDELLNGGKTGVVVMSGTWDLGAFGGDLTAEDLTSSLGELITALHDAGHHVLIVLPTPRFFYGEEPGTFAPSPPDTGAREPHATVWRPQNCPSSIAQSDPAACGATIAEDDVETSQELMMATLRQIADDTGASTLYLRPRYCTDGVCATNDGNVWFFEDGLHISVDESQALVPTFARVFQDIIDRRAEGEPLTSVEYVYRADDVAG
jgi:lysophospholipase L1-like esterase